MSEEIRISVGARLKEERERLDLTQADLALLLGVSTRSALEWEKGKSVPNAEALALLAGNGVDVLYVVTGQRVPSAADSLTPEEKALIDNYKHSDEEGRAAARHVLSSLAKSKAA